MDSNILAVEIITPDEVIFKGEARLITSFNESGEFDILPFHENFITAIKEKIIIFLKNDQKKELTLQSGIMRIREGKVEVFLGIGLEG